MSDGSWEKANSELCSLFAQHGGLNALDDSLSVSVWHRRIKAGDVVFVADHVGEVVLHFKYGSLIYTLVSVYSVTDHKRTFRAPDVPRACLFPADAVRGSYTHRKFGTSVEIAPEAFFPSRF